MKEKVTFVLAVNDRQMLAENFLASPLLQAKNDHEIILQENFSSATRAYNDAIRKAKNDLIIFCHQDVLLPCNFLSQVQNAVQYLETHDPNWGVLGSYGKTQDGRGWGHVYSSGRNVIGGTLPVPVSVQTLDEIVLILRKSSGLRFDEELPHFHFYGSDICLRAAASGRRSYAISAFCIHNTQQTLVLPPEFYRCSNYIRRAWRNYLPIQTTCIRITRSNLPVYARRSLELYLRYIRKKEIGGRRRQNPSELLRELSGISGECA